MLAHGDGMLAGPWCDSLKGGGRRSGRGPSPSDSDRQKIQQQLHAIGEKVQQLEKDGKHDEAEGLKREARRLYSKLNPHAGAVPGGPEREQIRQQWLSLHRKIEAAAKSGSRDEVKQLQQQAEALRARLYPQGEHVAAQSPAGDQRVARLRHLRVAAENLKAAGAEGEAQHVMQMIAHMEQEAGNGASPSALSMAVQEFAGNSSRCIRELRELHEQLNRLKASGRTRGRPGRIAVTVKTAVAVENPPQTEQQRQGKPAAARPKKQPPYAVVLLNDDEHSFQYVVETLAKVFGYPLEKCYSLTEQVHLQGAGSSGRARGSWPS